MHSYNMVMVMTVLYLSFCVSTSVSLLRNCVPPAEWNKDLTTPRCEIITNSTHEKCYGANEISVPRNKKENIQDKITLICKAHYPLDADVNGVKLKGFPGIFSFREVQNISDLSTYEYSIRIPLYATSLWSPRWYTIRSIKNPDIKTQFYLYRPGPNDAVLPTGWSSEKRVEVVVKPESRFAVLPCVVHHYTDHVILTRLNLTDNKYHDVETNNITVKFEPKAGFILDTSVTPPPWGRYMCKAKNVRTRQPEYFDVTLDQPEDFIPSPSQPVLQMFEGSTLILTCQSKRKLQMNGEFNGIKIPQHNFSYIQNDDLLLKYSAQFQLSNKLQISDTGTVKCVQEDSDALFFKWDFNTFDLAHNEFLQFNGNKEREVSCQSKADYVNLFSAECFNFAQCKSRSEFYSTLTTMQCDLPLLNVINCATICGEDNKVCFKSSQIRGSGIFKCEGPDLSKLLHFVKGWSGKLYTNLDSNLSEVPAEEIIRISVGDDKLYLGGLHTFKCEASSFLSNGEYLWFHRTKNATLIKPTIEAVRGVHDYWYFNNSIWEADIRLDNPDVTEVGCLVPRWNSDEWVQISREIKIQAPEMPNIDSAGTEAKFFIGEEGRSLSCRATGEPRPTLMWTINGRNVTKPFGILNDHSEHDIILEFPKITAGLMNDEFACTANNFLGSFTKVFIVEIAERPNITIYIVLGIVLLVLLVITLIILYWKLMKAKSAIRNLSDEEVQEFINGNPKAAELATEPQELVLCLPYNAEFEIPMEKLRFDEKDVLGSGAYGIVFRGMLMDHPGDVAIKTVKPYSAVTYFKALLSELKIMIYIGKHENVVHLIGAYTGNIKERMLYMVVELSPYGNLENFLRHNQNTFKNEIRDDRICFTKNMMQVLYTNVDQSQLESGYINSLSTTELVSWALQISEGMNHLANKKVIHADLATRNVLLYDNGVCKITDFGLSRQLYAYTSYMKKEQEPLPWRSMAIESLREMNFSTQSDVWAYGITLWEIFSLGAVPYPGLSWSVDFVDKLNQGLRLSKPQFATTEIYNLMIQCWHSVPEERPSFIEIRNVINEISSSVKKLGGK